MYTWPHRPHAWPVCRRAPGRLPSLQQPPGARRTLPGAAEIWPPALSALPSHSLSLPVRTPLPVPACSPVVTHVPPSPPAKALYLKFPSWADSFALPDAMSTCRRCLRHAGIALQLIASCIIRTCSQDARRAAGQGCEVCALACWLAAVLVLARRACTSASLFTAAILAMWASCSSLNLPTLSCRWQLLFAWDAEVYLGSQPTHNETHSGLRRE
jgi:hypothetical protein